MMKGFFRWAGWVLFACFSYLLLHEYLGMPAYDTSLFSLGGQSVGLQSENVLDLSPILMGSVYIILLIINIIAVFLSRDSITISISNLLLSVPVMLVLHVFVSSYPPFGQTECFVLPISLFLLYAYASAALFLLFLGYSAARFVKHKKST